MPTSTSNLGEQSSGFGFAKPDDEEIGLDVLGKSLSRLETSQSTPPFFQLYFLLRLKMSEICSNSLIMLGKAICGNGFIHLNIAEIYEEDIGGQKTCAYFTNQGRNERFDIRP